MGELSIRKIANFLTSLPGAKGGLSRWLIHTTAVSTQELRTTVLYEFIATTYAVPVRDKPAASPKPISAFPVPTSFPTGLDPLQQHGSPCPTRVLCVCVRPWMSHLPPSCRSYCCQLPASPWWPRLRAGRQSTLSVCLFPPPSFYERATILTIDALVTRVNWRLSEVCGE